MRLNKFETALMNNPIRRALQKYLEVSWLRKLGEPNTIDRALEIGCGSGHGVRLILDEFGASRVDAFDLDPDMISCAKQNLSTENVRFWVGDVCNIEAEDNTYDAVFDFGIIHHVPEWRIALKEVYRVLKPGGRFYAEEVLKDFILHPIVRRFLLHPIENRFTHNDFLDALVQNGFDLVGERRLGRSFGWYVTAK